MGELGLDVIDRTVHDTNVWLKEISEEMQHPDRQMAYHALRGVLFTLRDRLTPEEACQFASQLPLLIRGVFFEGYRPANKPEKFRDREEWLRRVNHELDQTGGQNPENASKAVFRVISRHITKGEQDDVRHMLPKDIRQLWPEEAAAEVS